MQAEINTSLNCFTGETVGDLTFHQGNVHALEDWLSQANTPRFNKIYAYSDSVFDLPLLEFADKPTVVNGCKALREQAELMVGQNSAGCVTRRIRALSHRITSLQL